MRLRTLAAALLALMAAPAQAEDFDLGEMARNLGVSELRAGFFFHGVELRYGYPFALDYSTLDPSKWQNLTGEVVFDVPGSEIFPRIGKFRLGVSGSLNFAGQDSYARLSPIYQVPVFDTGLFVEAMAGGVVHNGYLDNAPSGRRELGCRFLYFYGANVGYDVSDTMSAMVTVEHASHWATCSPTENDGINRIGLRLGWKLK